MTDTEKLNSIIEKLCLGNKANFARKVRTSPQTVTNWLNRGISKDGILAISQAFPDLNQAWLLYGEGEMLKTNEESPVINYADGVPYYDEDFVLGFNEIGFPFAEKPSFLVRMPKYQNATLWCNATGDSMVPEINSGDVVALQLVEDHSFLVYGDVYAIVTTNGLRTIKRLGRSEDKNCYRLIPTNRAYDDQDIPKGKILRVFRVLGNLHTF